MISRCWLFWNVDNHFYFELVLTFWIQFSWELRNLSAKRATRLNFYWLSTLAWFIPFCDFAFWPFWPPFGSNEVLLERSWYLLSKVICFLAQIFIFGKLDALESNIKIKFLFKGSHFNIFVNSFCSHWKFCDPSLPN